MEINLTIKAIIFYSSKVRNFLFHKHCIHEQKFLSKYNEITHLYIHLKSKGKLSKGSKSKISVTSIILHFIEVQGQSFKSKISVTSVTLHFLEVQGQLFKSKILVTSMTLHFIEVQGQSFKSKILVTSVTLHFIEVQGQ